MPTWTFTPRDPVVPVDSTRRRSVGGNDPTLAEYVTAGGVHYWQKSNEPDYGYIGGIRYPISYIVGLAVHVVSGASTQQAATGQEIQAAALGGKIAVIYGQDRVGGDVFFGPWVNPFQGTLYVGWGLGEGEIDSIIKAETSTGVTVQSAIAAKAITGATNASPIVITATAHQRATGDSIVITGVVGNTAANGGFVVTVIDANTLSLNGSSGNGAYTSGGVIAGTTSTVGASFAGFGGQASFNFYKGLDSPPTLDPFFALISAAYAQSFDERYPGLAYVSGQLVSDPALLPSFPDIRWTVKGRKLLDPRLGVDGSGIPNQPAVWSDNPILCLVDYMTSVYYGLGIALAQINWTSVAAIANWCEAVQGTAITNATNAAPIVLTSTAHGRSSGDTVTVSGVVGNTAANGTWLILANDANTITLLGTTGNGAYVSGGTVGRKRFTFNSTLRREASHKANIDFIRSHFRCTYAKTNGLYTFYVDQPSASVKVFDEIDRAITAATNATPIVVTCPGHLRNTGDSVFISGVTGNTAANGRWTVTVVDANTLSLNTSVGNGAYIDGGKIVGNCRALKRWRTPSDQLPTKITYDWTDPARDYQTATAMDITAGAQAGTTYTRVANYNADGCRNVGQGQSQATYLLKKRQKDLNHSIICNRAEGLAMEMYDVCTLNLPSFGISNYSGRIVRISKFATGEFQFDFEDYDSTIYGEVVAGTETKPVITLPNPSAVPPVPPLPTLIQDGYDIVVTLNAPTPAYPFYAGQRVTWQRLGFAASLLPDNLTGPIRIVGVSLGSLYTITSQTISLSQGIQVLSAPCAAQTITPVLQAGMSIRDGKALTVISDRQNISYDGNNQLVPATQTTTFTAIKQNILTLVQWTMTRTDGTTLDPSLYLSATSGDQVTMTSANFETARGSTTGVIVSATAVEIA